MLLRTLSHSVKQTTEVADSRAISEEFSCLLLNSKIKWAGHVARVTERRISYRIFVGNPEGSNTLARTKRRWEDNIKLYLKELRWGGVNRIRLMWDKLKQRDLVKSLVNFMILQNMGNFLNVVQSTSIRF
jgi:hypothetical protein